MRGFDVSGRFGRLEDLAQKFEHLGLSANAVVEMVGGLGGFLASRGRQYLSQIPEEHLQLVGGGVIELVATEIQDRIQRTHEGSVIYGRG